jgi:hypothetical protein
MSTKATSPQAPPADTSDQAIDWLMAVRKYGLATANAMFPEG